jgi:L-fucose isomerase-like protein
VPCACEADVYGAATQLLLQEVAGAPVFLADLVDLDPGDDTGVVWHCGQAPISMRAPAAQATATVHTNRRMPLLYEFPLKPGRVTFMRLSQAFGTPKMIIASGEVLDRPMAFTGTSGVVRFDTPAERMLGHVIGSGLEHHMALAYGDHAPMLRETAAALSLPVMEL